MIARPEIVRDIDSVETVSLHHNTGKNMHHEHTAYALLTVASEVMALQQIVGDMGNLGGTTRDFHSYDRGDRYVTELFVQRTILVSDMISRNSMALFSRRPTRTPFKVTQPSRMCNIFKASHAKHVTETWKTYSNKMPCIQDIFASVGEITDW